MIWTGGNGLGQLNTGHIFSAISLQSSSAAVAGPLLLIWDGRAETGANRKVAEIVQRTLSIEDRDLPEEFLELSSVERLMYAVQRKKSKNAREVFLSR
jgi:hypothetical protein